MHDSVDDEGWIRMGGGMRGLKASALVNGYVNQHRTCFHVFHHLSSDEFWRSGAGNQNTTDNQVRIDDGL